MRHTVQDFLGQSPFARVAAKLDLGAGRSVTIWENHDDHVCYEEPVGHTFSLYLRGGTGTKRLDAGAVSGWPGAICIMPEGHRSEWQITAPFRFVHLYLPDAKLRAAYALIDDCGARRMDLQDVTFAENSAVAGPLAYLARAAMEGDSFLADTAIAELTGNLPARKIMLKGGLPSHLLRRVDEWVEAHLEDSIRLTDLAGLAGLSEFHFHRMFCLSRGMPPHAWITARRVERAKSMLRRATPLIEIALACGFSSQSHLTRMFRKQTGRTPAEYRAALGQVLPRCSGR